jgi:hypothetical protein
MRRWISVTGAASGNFARKIQSAMRWRNANRKLANAFGSESDFVAGIANLWCGKKNLLRGRFLLSYFRIIFFCLIAASIPQLAKNFVVPAYRWRHHSVRGNDVISKFRKVLWASSRYNDSRRQFPALSNLDLKLSHGHRLFAIGCFAACKFTGFALKLNEVFVQLAKLGFFCSPCGQM